MPNAHARAANPCRSSRRQRRAAAATGNSGGRRGRRRCLRRLGQVSGPSGGSEIWRIGTDGEPTLYWSSSQAVVYALTFDAAGRLLVADGNQGRIIGSTRRRPTRGLRTPKRGRSRRWRSCPAAHRGRIANPGKLLPARAGDGAHGTLESDVLDAASFTYWGRLRWGSRIEPRHASSFETRSGNLDAPEKNWSAWARWIRAKGARVRLAAGAVPAMARHAGRGG